MTTSEDTVVDIFWKSLAFHEQMYVLESDPMFRYFDRVAVQGIIEGKPSNFTIEKISELQDRLEQISPKTKETEEIENILASSKARPVRSHKLVKAIRERCEHLHNNRDTALEYLKNAPLGGVEEDVYPDKPNNVSAEVLMASQTAQRTEALPAATQALPSRMSTDTTDSEKFPMTFALSASLPQNAKINVRSSPDVEHENVVGNIQANDQVIAVGNQGNWLEVRWPIGQVSSTAWVLSVAGEVPLLVPVGGRISESSVQAEAHEQPLNQIETHIPTTTNELANTIPAPAQVPQQVPAQTVPLNQVQEIPQVQPRVSQPLQTQTTPPSPPIAEFPVTVGAEAAQNFKIPSVSALLGAPNTPSGKFVTYEEYQALESKVERLESELFRVMALLRSV